MILTAVKPDDAGMVGSFRHETLQCSVCQDIERRFVFGSGSSEKLRLPPVPARPQQPSVSFSSFEAISASPPQSSSSPQTISFLPSKSLQPEAVASASTWLRAVEKLRNRQADIRVPADDEKNDWHARFNQTWEKLAALRKHPTASDAAPRRPKHLVRKSARALRDELCGSSSAGDCPKQLIIAPSAEEIQRFNRFWDSLLPTRQLPAEASITLAKPLPRSLSLVRVENLEGVSIARRAILLLRGSQASKAHSRVHPQRCDV